MAEVQVKALLTLVGLIAVCGIIQSVNVHSNLSMASDDPELWQTGLLATAMLLTVALGLLMYRLKNRT